MPSPSCPRTDGMTPSRPVLSSSRTDGTVDFTVSYAYPKSYFLCKDRLVQRLVRTYLDIILTVQHQPIDRHKYTYNEALCRSLASILQSSFFFRFYHSISSEMFNNMFFFRARLSASLISSVYCEPTEEGITTTKNGHEYYVATYRKRLDPLTTDSSRILED